MLSRKQSLDELESQEHTSTYSSRYFKEPVPKYDIPDHPIPANAAYQLIHDEMDFDANPALNVASFVTTWMEKEAKTLIVENLHKNFIDHEEYPQTEVIHTRCVTMLSRLFHSPKESVSIGTACIGSSEAIMLALLAHKWNWRQKRQQEGKSASCPNMIFGAEVHVCWEKFAKYFDVEMRVVPLCENRFTATAEEVEKRIDENTICVGAVLGTTYSGQIDPIESLNNLLVNVKQKKGLDIPIHVDGASGGFVLPFTEPQCIWDFQLEQVRSINVSGHKYGLVFPGIGWMLWKDEKDFPEDLIFKVDYLGSWMPTYTLNFSRASFGVLAQYYNFLRLGKSGYAEIMHNCLANATYLASLLEKSQKFVIVNPGSRLPIVTFRLTDKKYAFTAFELAEKLRERGWIVPAYTLPPNAEKITLMRVVVRENFSRDMADILYQDIEKAIAQLEKSAPSLDERPPHKQTPIC